MRFLFDNSLVPDGEWRSASEKLAPYIKRLSAIANKGLYKDPESSILFPEDGALRGSIESIIYEKARVLPKIVLLIGIGGSSLPIKALYEALLSTNTKAPRLIILDSNKPEVTESTLSFVEENTNVQDDVLIVVASKSGKTIETISNAEYSILRLGKKFPDIKQRTIVISDEDSALSKEASSLGMSVANIPASVGGRFSVFSATGLLTLGVLGIDTEELLEGALEMREKCLSDQAENPAVMSATFLYYWHKRGKNVHDTFFFNPHLESTGKWYRELLAESIGKTKDIGITPTVSIGPADLHSTIQLFLGGPKDKTVFFVFEENGKRKPQVPFSKDRIFKNVEEAVSGKTFGEILDAIYKSAKDAYADGEIPFGEVLLENGSAGDMGAFFQWKMMEVMYLAELLGVNAFDQPAVEGYKREIRNILNGN